MRKALPESGDEKDKEDPTGEDELGARRCGAEGRSSRGGGGGGGGGGVRERRSEGEKEKSPNLIKLVATVRNDGWGEGKKP